MQENQDAETSTDKVQTENKIIIKKSYCPTHQETIPTRNVTNAHAQAFVANNELLLPIPKACVPEQLNASGGMGEMTFSIFFKKILKIGNGTGVL